MNVCWLSSRQLDRSLAKRPRSEAGAVARRIGRWLGRYPAAERLLGQAAGLEIVDGAYLLRTNCTETDPVKLWCWYIQLQQAEAVFRISKNDLVLRPLYHQKTERVEAHILVCFLPLAPLAYLGNVDALQGTGDLRTSTPCWKSRRSVPWT